MSRIGKKPVAVPAGVTLDVTGQDIKAKGSKGELSVRIHDDVLVKLEDGQIVLQPRPNAPFSAKIWPTMRTLVSNIVVGVTEGFTKKLEIHGVGLRGNMQGNTLVMQLGFSHEVRYDVPEGVTVEVADQTKITVSGIDKQKVGQAAANIREFKKPEPYKGKGIRYADEFIMRKEGKKK
ncbi:MAG: 50S ribosomal protein L6 [Alphaproteobacteria bacterium]|nr:50S ribosomal protein L6 [Alphaproteobacteria bacterium]NCQ88839.1 50S ribosomal protein L6 [Alphaproteobacteria bacterium]NCT07238.1 50S ribosomal protein L6 [Alphaproteobacteria bacterium]